MLAWAVNATKCSVKQLQLGGMPGAGIKGWWRMQLERAKASPQPIKVVMPDGAEKEGVRGVTTPMDIIKGVSKSLANAALVAKVDGQVWDLFRPLEGDCALQVLGFDDPEGKEVRAAHKPPPLTHQRAVHPSQPRYVPC